MVLDHAKHRDMVKKASLESIFKLHGRVTLRSPQSVNAARRTGEVEITDVSLFELINPASAQLPLYPDTPVSK